MNFEFSDDQEQLRDACARWVEKGYPFDRRRSIVENGGFSWEAWRELAALGLTGLYVPQDFGGMEMGPIDALVVLEELGKGIVLEPLSQALVCSRILMTYAPPAEQRRWLPAIASGDSLLVLAHQERRSRYRLDHCETQATENPGGWTLSGAKSMVPAGDLAHAFIVPAVLEGQLALWIVERQASGVHLLEYGMQDGSRAAELTLNDSPATLLTNDGSAALALAFDTGVAAVCAEAVGAMDRIFSLTVDYLKTRQQFGVPISEFQALRHRVADMKMHLELARSMSYYASLNLEEALPDRRLAISQAKHQLGTSMRFVGQQSVQLHGGIGLTDEYIGSHYFRVLTQKEMTWGDTSHHLEVISARIQAQASSDPVQPFSAAA